MLAVSLLRYTKAVLRPDRFRAGGRVSTTRSYVLGGIVTLNLRTPIATEPSTRVAPPDLVSLKSMLEIVLVVDPLI